MKRWRNEGRIDTAGSSVNFTADFAYNSMSFFVYITESVLLSKEVAGEIVDLCIKVDEIADLVYKYGIIKQNVYYWYFMKIYKYNVGKALVPTCLNKYIFNFTRFPAPHPNIHKTKNYNNK